MHVFDRTTALAIILLLGPAGAAYGDVLLIPDSGNDRLWAFDPYDGAVLSEAFIPADGNMVQPINAIDSGSGTILVSDENADAVLEYAYDGTFLGFVAVGLDALQGMTMREGDVYVGSRSDDVVYRVDPVSGTVEIWSADEALGTPRDLVFRDQDVLITNSDSQSSGGENIERFDLGGAFVETFHDSDGVGGIDFPQQLQLLEDGQVLAAGFSPPFGLYLYDSDGNELNAFTNIITSPRGVYQLGNGMYLYSGGTRVMRYDPATMTEETIVNESGTSFRYIEFSVAPKPCPLDLNGDRVIDRHDLLIVVGAIGPCEADCPFDLDGDGVVTGRDVSTVAREFGQCED